MKVGLLGGGGCFALNFANHLHSVGIDRFGIGRSHKPTAFWQVDHHYRYWKMHLVTDLQHILAVLDTERPDVIVNFAAQGEGSASFGENAPSFFDTNVTALVRLVLALRERTYLQRFVQVGSSEVYGSTDRPADETFPLRPTSPYAISKATFDQYLVSLHKNLGFQMSIVRPSNCYVKGQQLYRVIPKTIICALKGEKLPLHGGGMAEKSYLHATDLSRAIMAVIEKTPIGRIYNVAPSVSIPIKNLVSIIAEACGKCFEDVAETVPDRVGQDAKYWLDASALHRDTFWTQTIGLKQGIEEMIAWVQKYPEILTMDTSYRHLT